MNKHEFIAAVCDSRTLAKLEMPKSAVTAVIEACFDTIEGALRKGDEVRLIGFGNFYVSQRKAGKGRNPMTGEQINIKASKQPKFRAGKQLKQSINGGKGKE